MARPRPRLPTRSNSHLSAGPPTDASKADDEAISDVYREVDSTGSISAAAKKLEQIARWADDPEEASYLQRHGVEDDAIMSDECSDDEAIQATGRSMGEAGRRDSTGEVVHLQEVVDGLWIGDLVAAMDTDGLEQRGITNILSLLRPRLQFSSSFSVYPLEIDDAADTDILTHLPSCVKWIEQILDLNEQTAENPEATIERDPSIARIAGDPKPGGILVHCQAGMSRSATVVAAYLMSAYDLDPIQAVTALKEKRPVVDPSETFWHQLGLFYNADGRVSLKDKSTRRFYMERTASHFMNGDGSAPPMDKMAKYPATPTPSNPPTPSGGHGRRKIRCKMCRRHLAVREHMMDHILDQAPAPISRPRTPSNFTLPSPKLTSSGDFANGAGFTERRSSVVSDVLNPLTGLPGAVRSRQASMSSPGGFTPAHQRSSSQEHSRDSSGNSNVGNGPAGQIPSPGAGIPMPKTSTPGLALTAASPEAVNQAKLGGDRDRENMPSQGILSRLDTASPKPMSSSPKPLSNPASQPDSPSAPAPGGRTFQSAEQLASRLPPHLLALRMAGSGGGASALSSPIGSSPASSPEKETSTQGQGGGGPPILVNPKCSGYFVEPLTWMEPVLSKGQIAGKLVCPNEKCGVKIGNFDWAGVQCGCREWVTPGFCIHRSKVDEVW
ncbi:hypothetical protein I317_02602 [Kwoniella heveanensis CBS 569]|nr:hypothetical protein I317_02602 [Kwoniella heveanensis CBS 569]